MSKELKEKLLKQIRSWYSLGAYCQDENGNFVPLDWSKTPDSYFDDEVSELAALITSEKIQMLERLLKKSTGIIGEGMDDEEWVVYYADIESELQKLKEGK